MSWSARIGSEIWRVGSCHRDRTVDISENN